MLSLFVTVLSSLVLIGGLLLFFAGAVRMPPADPRYAQFTEMWGDANVCSARMVFGMLGIMVGTVAVILAVLVPVAALVWIMLVVLAAAVHETRLSRSV